MDLTDEVIESHIPPEDKRDKPVLQKIARKIIEDFDKVLSLDLLKKEDSTIDKELESYIKDMIDKRNEYKKNKDYEKADVIREELKEKGILIKDTRDGTIYELEN